MARRVSTSMSERPRAARATSRTPSPPTGPAWQLRPDLPRHPVRQPLRGRDRPDRAPLGRRGGPGARPWDQVASSAMRSRGDAIVSHEILASASSEQVRRAMESFAGTEVHVIFSARDLGRQIPAEWQETVKHRGRTQFGQFLRVVAEGPPHRLRGVVLAGAGTPRRARQVERRPEPGARPPGHGPTARRRAGPALGAVRRRPRRRPGTRGGERPDARTRRSTRSRRRSCAGSTSRSRGARSRSRSTPTSSADSSHSRRCPAGSSRSRPSCRRRADRSSTRSPPSGGSGCAAPASTSSATSTSSRRGGPATGSGPTPTGHDHGP